MATTLNPSESVLEIVKNEGERQQPEVSTWRLFVRAFLESKFYKVMSLFFQGLRWLFAIGLFCLSAAFIINGIFGKTSTIYNDSPDMEPILAFVITIVLLLLLGFLEGLGVGVVSIQLAHPRVFTVALNNKYPRAQQVHALISGSNSANLLAFILGRQVLVTFVVFALSLFVQFATMKYFPWSDTEMTITIFASQGIVSVIVVGCLGQLAPQLVAAAFPVQFTDIPFGYTIIQICIFIDSIGLTYFSWLEAKVVEVVLRLNRDINRKLHEENDKAPETPKLARSEASGIFEHGPDHEERFELTKSGSPLRKMFNIFRYVWSTIMILFCLVFVLPAIVAKQTAFSTTFPDVHGVVCLLIFLLLLLALWVLEGTQIAIVNLARPSDHAYRDQYPRAARQRKLVANNEGAMGSYLIGRQFLTVLVVFFAANFTQVKMDYYPGTDWQPGDTFNSIFLVSGLMGTLITTLCGQLTPRLLCADFPVQTLSLPGLAVLVYVCRAVEFIGIGHFTWILYYVFSFNLDTKVTNVLNSQLKLVDEDLNLVSRDEFSRLSELVRSQEERLKELQAKFEELSSSRKQQ